MVRTLKSVGAIGLTAVNHAIEFRRVGENPEVKTVGPRLETLRQAAELLLKARNRQETRRVTELPAGARAAEARPGKDTTFSLNPEVAIGRSAGIGQIESQGDGSALTRVEVLAQGGRLNDHAGSGHRLDRLRPASSRPEKFAAKAVRRRGSVSWTWS